MQFTRLKLSGFKSFVDPTELMIEPGMTGVVGPNGCGKSNLIEALRWVMGETSAKKMRGSGMDDVIFNGTTTRPARNLAEVTLSLDNSERQAPAAYNEADEIEVTRRIQRESGSTYLINGHEVRAKDVQLLFADLATGAHSTALVSQGQIGALINAKPIQRRHVLEEAAGITGLHSRRHEAELRLRAAEANMERLEDVVQAMEGQLGSLKRQARQASRYRNISDHIRKAEATALHIRYVDANSASEKAAEDLKLSETKVADLTRVNAVATTTQNQIAEKLPPLRQAEAECAAALHRLTAARDGLEAEERRAREIQTQLENRLTQIAADLSREEEHGQDADRNVARLNEEHQELELAREGEVENGEAAEEKVEATRDVLTTREGELDEASHRVAQEDAQRNGLRNEIENVQRRLARLQQRHEQVTSERDRLVAAAEAEGEPEIADGAIEEAAQRAVEAHEATENAEMARADAQLVENERREVLQTMEKDLGRIGGEESALRRLLSVEDEDLWPPVIDAITVEAGYEAALGAAFGDDLDVPTDEGAPVYWREMHAYENVSALPDGCEPLSNYVTGPPALVRRLSQIGIVTSDEDGNRLLGRLVQGQRLVSRDGGLWRWDGYTATSGAPTTAAQRLAQRNRLEDLGRTRAELEEKVGDARDLFETASAAARQATEAEQASREAARNADALVHRMQETHARAVEARASRESRLTALNETLEEAQTDVTEAAAAVTEAQESLEAMPPMEAAREAVAALREQVGTLRRDHGEAVGARDSLLAQARGRAQRLQAIDNERQSWTSRKTSAHSQIEQLTARREEVTEELETARAIPEEIAERREALLSQIETSEEARNEAADALATTETALSDCEKELREAANALAAAREDRVRIEARVAQAAQSIQEIVTRMREILDCMPDKGLEIVDLKEGEELPQRDAIDNRLERLKRERDNMGPVNLRAEAEAAELTEQIQTMVAERADLEEAIARLRQGISSLNREGRERLLAAFKEVDTHFRELFVQLFGGGQAHLALTESDDPLEAGLEIMASPPGKRMQNMSLLSGGEQALTATSLLFAVFLTNPAPICVLDEVDAPLDDSNVERFVKLVNEISASSGTRFLIITHNPVSMAAMERLFGVTMGERGVSQLVSVDLAQAEVIRESA
ncbi:MAG: chromosome segregation protein SMC [Alphaproteobacteria bacterium]|nr:chromosome segregation protein SMC [Alphaproteobacteria bacterium]